MSISVTFNWLGWRTSCASWTPEVRLLRGELLLFFLLIRLPFTFFRSFVHSFVPSFVQSFVRSYFRSYVFFFIKSSFNLIGYVYLFWKKFLFISSGNKRHIVLEGKRHFFEKPISSFSSQINLRYNAVSLSVFKRIFCLNYSK